MTRRIHGRGLPARAAAVSLLALLAACRSDFDNATLVAISDPGVRHPIVVTAERPFIELALPKPPEQGLDPEQRFHVARFLRQYQLGAEGKLIVSLPKTNTKHDAYKAALLMEEVRHMAQLAGVSRGHVYLTSHAVPAPHEALVRLSFQRIAAVPPECGDWSENISRNRENVPYANFGCATQRNLAAMVANPADLVLSAGETPRSSERRSYVWRKYIDGTISDTSKENNLPRTNQR